MVWRADGPQGFESSKVKFDIVEYFKGDCLDLGCGPMKIFPAWNITGIDNNKDKVLFGTPANPDIFGDVEKLNRIADASHDCVFSSHTLEHIEDYESALAEWWRVVKPGGVLILYLPHRDWYPNKGMPGANPDHKHDFVNDDITLAMGRIAKKSQRGWTQERDEVRSQNFEYSFLQVYRKRQDQKVEVYVEPPKPEKSLGIVRLGAFGDALWITTVLPTLKKEGWHITLYTQRQGETSLRLDPNIDRMIVQADGIFGEGATAAQNQAAYWLHCERKHDQFINLVGSVERHLLPHPSDPNFFLPTEQRRRLMGKNYYESVHEWAGVKFDRATVRVKFTPSREEMAKALEMRSTWPEPLVMINPSGSSLPKWWPHAQEAMDLLSAAGIGGILVGDLRGQEFNMPPRWMKFGQDVDLRTVYTLASMCDVVVGTESAIVNAVAHEKPLKIVLLSHSAPNNLTRDWTNTVTLHPEGLKCYPCHRIHEDWTHCTHIRETNSAACQHVITAESVVGYALDWIKGEMKEAA